MVTAPPDLISVVIPTFRRAALLAEAVASVLAQDHEHVEVIVVGDGHDVELAVDDDRVIVIRTPENGGAAAARNAGVRRASGPYLTFLDDDDTVMPDRFAGVLDTLRDVDVALCWSRWQDDPPRSPGRSIDGVPGATVAAGPVPQVGATTLRRAAFIPFDETLRTGEDVEWWLRLGTDRTVATVPVHGHAVRRHDGDRGDKGPSERAAAHRRIIQQHGTLLRDVPAALAYRWYRVGRLHDLAGERGQARDAYRQSLRAAPTARAAVGLVGRPRRRQVRTNGA